MTDRELLQRAAKAAGIVIDKSPFNGGGHGNTGFDTSGNAVLDWHNGQRWNPLTDDGDALRLAVKLRLRNVSDEAWVIESTSIDAYERDPYAATRRAIVRAAAAMAGD